MYKVVRLSTLIVLGLMLAITQGVSSAFAQQAHTNLGFSSRTRVTGAHKMGPHTRSLARTHVQGNPGDDGNGDNGNGDNNGDGWDNGDGWNNGDGWGGDDGENGGGWNNGWNNGNGWGGAPWWNRNTRWNGDSGWNGAPWWNRNTRWNGNNKLNGSKRGLGNGRSGYGG